MKVHDTYSHLYIDNVEYFEKVVKHAESIGKLDKLNERLKFLNDYSDRDTRCTLYKDFAPLSFGFQMEYKKDGLYQVWFHGGVIYHGDHDNGGDGGMPTLSVNVTPVAGWAIHT